MTPRKTDIHFPIYLDNHASTRVDPRVVQAMLPFFTEQYGNASSSDHRFGWYAKEAVDMARRRIAKTIHAEPNEIIFTSGATESNNLALKGIAETYRDKGNHLVTCATEHSSVLDVCRSLELSGFRVTVVPVDWAGRIEMDAFEAALTRDTILVSVMAANNEIGTCAPIEALGRMCRSRQILFHTDAAQAFGKIQLNVRTQCIDVMSLSAHKIYGPKGIGALFLRRSNGGVRLMPQVDGGGHEWGLRAGSLNVPGIVGFGEAAHLAESVYDAERKHLAMLRDKLEQGITESRDVIVNGDTENRLPNNSSLTFFGITAKELMSEVREIAISTGSACTSEDIEREEYSHVLKAIGLDSEQAKSTVRFGVGRFTTENEIDYTVARITAYLRQHRAAAALATVKNYSTRDR
ncbi:MAG TPA: aminotransferase class V-fold PLP-dependent enzyme [Bacteroidota bacterium]|nr:aminotransferase class V-fold PLP-dependent enzyme [Bacteroidota bacterium]